MTYVIDEIKYNLERPGGMEEIALTELREAFKPALVGKPTMWALDFGAGCGDSSIMLASMLSPESRVICFEPRENTRDALLSNLKANPFCEYDAFFLAAGTEDGFVQFVSGHDNGGVIAPEFDVLRGHSFSHERVPMVNILKFLRNTYSDEELAKIKCIKTDCEGYDYIILQALLPLIKANKPVVIAENWPDEAIRKKLLDTMEGLGYTTICTGKNHDYVFKYELHS